MRPTVDSDSNRLMENEAILSNECRDFPQSIQLQVLSRDTFTWCGLDDLELESIGLSDSFDRSGSWVVLVTNCQPLYREQTI